MTLLVTASGATPPSLGLLVLLRLQVLLARGGEVILATQSPLTVLVDLVLVHLLSAGRPDCFGASGLWTRLAASIVRLCMDQAYRTTPCLQSFLAFRSIHGSVDVWYLAVVLQLLLSLLVLVDEPKIKLGDFSLLHAKNSTRSICNASELTGVKVARSATTHNFLQIMVHGHAICQTVKFLRRCTLAATVDFVALRWRA